jgi:hypothetical protein
MASNSDSGWDELHVAWQQHGNSPAFWNSYQQVLETLSAGQRDPGTVANRLALMAQRLGAVERALMI